MQKKRNILLDGQFAAATFDVFAGFRPHTAADSRNAAAIQQRLYSASQMSTTVTVFGVMRRVMHAAGRRRRDRCASLTTVAVKGGNRSAVRNNARKR
uniref:Beta-lactamase n=1 Tax=Ascaris lumbricoides TaxID=6252 RepID=A0A0M3I6N6_ASCLU